MGLYTLGMKIDLDAKLQAVALERQTLRRRLEYLDGVERAIRLLITEEQVAAAQQLVLFPGKNGNGQNVIGRTPVSRLLVEVLGDAASRQLDALSQIAEARGMDFAGKNAKRVLHFALIGLQRNGYAQKDANGWRLSEKALRILRSAATPSGDKEDPIKGNNTPAVAGR
ncbi:MAG: hypothetical protein HYU29_07450 [Chloroflexi bacterium]|nr:hypothetical protein [Chloroflexota bacterium]